MKRQSAKTAARDREYARRRRQYLLLNPNCEVMWDGGCSMQASMTHHVVLRAHLSDEQMLEQANWKSTCGHCHHMIHDHTGEAYERGHLAKSWDFDSVVAAKKGIDEHEQTVVRDELET